VIREYTNVERSSIVFKVRAKPSHLIDCSTLLCDSETDSEILGSFLKKETVGEYIRDQLSVRESVNFPKNSGFETYANCILDPDRNISQSMYQSNLVLIDSIHSTRD